MEKVFRWTTPEDAIAEEVRYWARESGVDDDGAPLVRSDQVIAWRSQTSVGDCTDALRETVAKLTGRA